MLGNFGGFCILGIVFGFHIIPWKFTEPCKPEPRTEHREIMKGLSLFLESGDLVVDHVHKDQPGFVMLGAFVGHCITALLCQ